MNGPDDSAVEVTAPAKLTLSLRVTGRRSDGYHLLESEMVTLDLADTLVLHPAVDAAAGLTVELELGGAAASPGHGAAASPGRTPWRADGAVPAADNLVERALRAVGRTASVRLTKRIPPGAGLGGGSADAAAVLRWAGCRDVAVAARLGSDVPFCLSGGRAMVRGVGEEVTALPYEERAFTLVLLPFGVATAAVYRAWDELAGSAPGAVAEPDGPGDLGVNDLEAAAVAAEPRLGAWRDHLSGLTGRRPWLAGSGSSWFFAGSPGEVGLTGGPTPGPGGESALVVAARTTEPLGPGPT